VTGGGPRSEEGSAMRKSGGEEEKLLETVV